MKFDDNVECQVICDGEHLTEYQERSEDNAKGRSCYIISEAGKRFFVRVKSLPRSSAQQTDLSAELWIDGQHMRNRPICEDGCDMDGVRTARSTVRPFIFTSITLTDDDSALQEGTAIVNELGTICIKVYRVKEYRDAGSSYTARSLKMQNTPVHERSKKAGGHRVTLGEARANERKSAMEIIYFDRKDSPYYTFTWRYRSKGILQAQGIVPLDSNTSSSKRPRSSSPSRSGGSQAFKRTRAEHSPLPHGSGSQMKLEDVPTAPKLQARVEALRAQRAALEAQEVALNEELRQASPGQVKRERSPIVFHGVRSRDVIDLTEDD